jgi:hypothetical protein
MVLSIVGLLGTEEEANEIKFISKVFLVAIRIKELVAEQNEKVNK